MGAPDDEMNRREELRDKRLKEMSEQNVVGGSNPDSGGEVSTAVVSTEAMLEQHGADTKNIEDMNTKTETQKRSPEKYADVPAYDPEDLDNDTLRTEVFPKLDFTDAEKQAAGAIVEYAGEDLTNSELAEKAGVSATTISRTGRMLRTSSDPNNGQLEAIKLAVENPELSANEISNNLGLARTNVITALREYRHHEVEVEVEVPVDEETGGETQETNTQGDDNDETEDNESTDADAVEKDLNGDEDVEYKYDPKDKSKKQTRGGQSLKKVSDQKHLVSLFRELDRRVRELEDSGAEVDVPDAIKGRISSLESQVDATQSVLDRVENQQANLERFVEDEMDTDSDFTEIREDLEAIRDMAFPEDADEEQFQKTSLGQHLLQIADRVDRIEDSLTSHKEALQALRDSDGGETSTSEFSTEEKRRMVVALAENGENELIDRVLDDL